MDILGEHEILLGTYEAFVLGYKLAEDVTGIRSLQTSFANHAHSSTVRSVAAADKFLVTAGSDENVKIFNLRNRTEHGNLTHSDGTLRSMRFYDKRHLVTGSEDNKICIIKATGGWNVEKTLAKHQGAVTDLAVHPSGKLMLSIGEDNKLVTWNLIKGRSAYVTNIKERADFVRWSPSGCHYIIGFYKHVDVYSVSNATVLFTIKTAGRSNDLVFLDDDSFALSGESPNVEFYSLVTGTLISQFEAHQNRVRCLAVIHPAEDGGGGGGRCCLVSASNDGMVKVWSVTRCKDEIESKMVASVNTNCRVTCMIVHKVPEVDNLSHQADEKLAVKRPLAEESSEAEEKGDHPKKKKKVQVVDEKVTKEDDVQETESKSTKKSEGGQKGTKKKKLAKKKNPLKTAG